MVMNTDFLKHTKKTILMALIECFNYQRKRTSHVSTNVTIHWIGTANAPKKKQLMLMTPTMNKKEKSSPNYIRMVQFSHRLLVCYFCRNGISKKGIKIIFDTGV